jgi:hypothetical protein
MGLKSNAKDKIFTGIIVLVHVVFFFLACMYKRIYMGDSFEYIYEALNIKRYFFFYSGNPAMPIVPEYMTQRQPLYPLFLLGVYLFSINNWIVIVLQNLLSVFNIYYARKVLIKAGYNDRYDWVMLLFVVAYPAQFINANTIAPDILLQTFTVLYFGGFISLLLTKQLKYAILMSLALTAGLFVKPVLYPFVVIHLFVLIGMGVYQKVALQRVVVLTIIPLCAVLCYNYSNYTRTGKFHFTSNQSFNAIYYYAEYFGHTSGKDSAVKFLQRERQDIAAIPNYADRYDYANEQGIKLLKQNFGPYMSYHLGNSARMLVEPGKAEMDLFTGKLTYGGLYHGPETGFYATLKTKGWRGLGAYMHNNSSMPFVLVVLLFNLFRLFGLIIFFLNKHINWVLRLFTFILIGYFVVAAGPIANTRYFLPVSLLAIGCSVLGYISQFGRTVKTSAT